jgi:hypothetical protein
VRAISAPFRRPDRRTFTPSAPLRIVLITARFIARRNITRFSICCAMPSATSCASSSGLRISAMFRRTSSRHAEQLRRLGAQLLDVLALLADHDARTRRLDRDVDLVGGALDLDAADRGLGQLLAQELAHRKSVCMCIGNCFLPAYHFDVQSRVMPRRMPIGLTF